MSNLQPNCCLEFDFQKVDQHAGGKWLIHDTKRRKDNQLQSLKLPCNERRRHNVTTFPIRWAHNQIDPCADTIHPLYHCILHILLQDI